MLVGKDSIFFKIPMNTNQRQLFILEGIRYCANSISLSYTSLRNEVEYISKNDQRDHSTALIFKEAWSQIDTTYRLTKLLEIMYSYDKSEVPTVGENFQFLLKTHPFRNTFQHLDERIDEFMLELNSPIWGSISWLNIVDKIIVNCFVLSAGHPRQNFEHSVVNPSGNLVKFPIDFITIESIQRNKNDRIVSLDLSELYRCTERLIKKFETSIEEQINSFEEIMTLDPVFEQDILVCLTLIQKSC